MRSAVPLAVVWRKPRHMQACGWTPGAYSTCIISLGRSKVVAEARCPYQCVLVVSDVGYLARGEHSVWLLLAEQGARPHSSAVSTCIAATRLRAHQGCMRRGCARARQRATALRHRRAQLGWPHAAWNGLVAAVGSWRASAYGDSAALPRSRATDRLRVASLRVVCLGGARAARFQAATCTPSQEGYKGTGYMGYKHTLVFTFPDRSLNGTWPCIYV